MSQRERSVRTWIWADWKPGSFFCGEALGREKGKMAREDLRRQRGSGESDTLEGGAMPPAHAGWGWGVTCRLRKAEEELEDGTH